MPRLTSKHTGAFTSGKGAVPGFGVDVGVGRFGPAKVAGVVFALAVAVLTLGLVVVVVVVEVWLLVRTRRLRERGRELREAGARGKRRHKRFGD